VVVPKALRASHSQNKGVGPMRGGGVEHAPDFG